MQSDLPSEAAPPANPQAQIHQLRTLRQAIVIGLVGFSLLSLILALFLIAASIRNDIGRSESNLAALQARLMRLSTPAPEVQELMTTLTNTLTLADTLVAARPPVGINWPAVVTVIGSYDPAAITLTALTQSDNRITLTGEAVDDVVVVTYARLLETSDLFANVVLQSLLRPTPTTVAAQTTPTALTQPTASIEFVIIIELSGQPS